MFYDIYMIRISSPFSLSTCPQKTDILFVTTIPENIPKENFCQTFLRHGWRPCLFQVFFLFVVVAVVVVVVVSERDQECIKYICIYIVR